MPLNSSKNYTQKFPCVAATKAILNILKWKSSKRILVDSYACNRIYNCNRIYYTYHKAKEWLRDSDISFIFSLIFFISAISRFCNGAQRKQTFQTKSRAQVILPDDHHIRREFDPPWRAFGAVAHQRGMTVWGRQPLRHRPRLNPKYDRNWREMMRQNAMARHNKTAVKTL